MRTFIENYLHFMKNCKRPHYEKLKPIKSGFIENSNFENNRPLPSPPPSLGNPCYKKKLGLFFILEPQEHFWSSPKNHNSGSRENNCVGNTQYIIPFISDDDPN